jgi:hypothetical protein
MQGLNRWHLDPAFGHISSIVLLFSLSNPSSPISFLPCGDVRSMYEISIQVLYRKSSSKAVQQRYRKDFMQATEYVKAQDRNETK